MNRQCMYTNRWRRVKKFGASALPSLHHRKEGWPSDQWNVAKPPLIARPGWFSDPSERKTTPSASASVASRNLLMTQPPLLAVVQGGECAGSEISAPYRFLQDSRTTVFHNASSIHRPTVDHLFLHRKQRRHEFDAVPEVLQAEVFVVAVLVVVMVANGNADLRNAKHAFGHIRSCCAGGWNFHRRASRAFHGPDYFP